MGRSSHPDPRWTSGAVVARRWAVFGMLGVAAAFAEVTYYLRDKDLLPGPEDEIPRMVLWRSLDLYPWVVLVLAALLWPMCRRTAARAADPGSARLPALGGMVIGWGLVLAAGTELHEYARIAHGDQEGFLIALILIVSVLAAVTGVLLIGRDRSRPLVMDMGTAGGLFVTSWSSPDLRRPGSPYGLSPRIRISLCSPSWRDRSRTRNSSSNPARSISFYPCSSP